MKMSVNKEYTTLAQLPKVKEDMKEFKARYTENDLLSYFINVTEPKNSPWCEDVILCNVEAFPGGSYYNDETSFSIEIVTRGFRRFHEIHFYCNLDMTIRTDTLFDGTKMYSCDSYVME